MAGNSPDLVQLSALLARVAAALEDVGADGRVLENRVADAVEAEDGNRVVSSLQGLDHLMQVVDNLSVFLRRIGEDLDRGPAADPALDPAAALDLIGLRALAERLAGAEAGEAGKDGFEDDLHLF